ncbi:hypothetical protein BKA70DRAFT_1233739 [Coprinopsis sp. MPI-PUGE-AT-0042]|nr:hypothetical protein BKA70DRAFT_1233739 [Coprinopsis sp. MPI-PUGE-AT-0042]
MTCGSNSKVSPLPPLPPINAQPEALRQYRTQIRSATCIHPSIITFVANLLLSLPLKAQVDIHRGVAVSMLLVEVLQAMKRFMMHSNETYSMFLHTLVGIQVIMAFAMSPTPPYLDSLVLDLTILTAVIRDPAASPIIEHDLKRFYRFAQTERHAFASVLLNRITAMHDRVGAREVPFEPFLLNVAEIANSLKRLQDTRWLWNSFLHERLPALLMASIYDCLLICCSIPTPVGNDLREQVLDATFALMEACLFDPSPSRHYLPTVRDILLNGYLKIMVSHVSCVSDKSKQDRYLSQIGVVAGLSTYSEVQPAVVHLVMENMDDLSMAFAMVGSNGDRTFEYLARIAKLADQGAVCTAPFFGNSDAVESVRQKICDNPTCNRNPEDSYRSPYKLCGGCCNVGYCSIACQEQGWGLHKHRDVCRDYQNYSSKDPSVLDPYTKTAWNVDCTRFPFPVVMEQGPADKMIFIRNQSPAVQVGIENFISIYAAMTPLNLLHGLLPFSTHFDVHVLLLIRPVLTPERKITCSTVSSFVFFDSPRIRPIYHQLESTIEGVCGMAGPSPPVVVVTAE